MFVVFFFYSLHIKHTKLPDLIWRLRHFCMPYGVQHLHSTGLNSLLIELEPSFTRVNRDSRRGWLETVGRVTSHQAAVCTSFILIREFNNSYLRKGTFVLFVQWALVVYRWKTSQKAFVWKEQGKQTPCVCRCRMGSWKGIRGTCKLLLAGLWWEVGEGTVQCVSKSCSLTASAKFLNNRNKGGEISCALTWNVFAPFIISCSNAQDIQLISHSMLSDLHNIYRNLLGCNLLLNMQNKLLEFTSNAKYYSYI